MTMSTLCLAAYDEKGEIRMVVCAPKESAYRSLTANSTLPYLELEHTPSNAQHYVLKEKLVERPEMLLVVEGLTISGVPAGASVTIENGPVCIADGTEIELSFNAPGTFNVSIEMWPYKKSELYIENPPQH